MYIIKIENILQLLLVLRNLHPQHSGTKLHFSNNQANKIKSDNSDSFECYFTEMPGCLITSYFQHLKRRNIAFIVIATSAGVRGNYRKVEHYILFVCERGEYCTTCNNRDIGELKQVIS